MTIKTTRYSPDTCQCVIEYTWDSEVTEANRTHTLSNYVNVCSSHQGLANNTTRFNTVLEENPRKNQAHQIILDNGPSTLYTISTDGTRIIRDTINFGLSWSGTAPDRVLTITVTGVNLTNQQKTAIRNALNTRFGSGKVNLV